MTSVFRTFEGHEYYTLKKLDLIALLFIKLYYNENSEIGFLKMAFWRMRPFFHQIPQLLDLPIPILIFGNIVSACLRP